MSNTKIFGANHGISTQQVIPDNQVALEVNSTDAEKYITLDTTDDASKVVLLGTHTAADNESSGMVGIREATPKAPLHIVGTGGSTGMSVDPTLNYSPTVFIENSSSNTKDRCLMILNGDGGSGAAVDLHHTDARRLGLSGYGSAAAIFSDNGVPLQISAVDGQYINFTTGDSESMRIDNDGKVGIGEDTPLCTTSGIHVKSADSGVGSVWANADEVVVEGSGESGITILSGNSSGTTSHGALIFGSQNSNEAGGIRYRHGAAGVNNYLAFRAAGEDKAFVDRDGQFGIIGAGAVSATAMVMARGNLKTQLTGHLDSSSSGTSLVGDTTDFKTQLQRGSAVKISTSAGNEIFTVESVTSDTVAVLDSAISGTPNDGSNILGDGTLLAAETGDQKQCFAIKPNGGIAVGFARDGDSNEFNNNILLINPDGFTDVGNCAKNVIIGYDPGPSELLKVTDSVIMGYKAGGKGNNYNINNSVVIGNETADSSSGAHESCVVLGKEAGINHATDGIAIGRDSNFTAGSTNEIVIGDAATGNGTNTVTLGNSSITAIHCQVQSISALSDSRIKQNVADSTVGLDFINALRPVSYQKLHPADYPAELLEHRFVGGAFDEDENEIPADSKPEDWSPVSEIGLIAQEVATVAEQFPLVDCHSTAPNGAQSVKYGAMIAPLIKAVQELAARIEVLENGD